MTFWVLLNLIFIQPLHLLFEAVFNFFCLKTYNPGVSLVILSVVVNILVLPLYIRADSIQEEENNIEKKLSKRVKHIKKTFKGDEKVMMLQTLYRQNNYRPTDVFKSSVPLLLQIPFFIAAYQFLSEAKALEGTSFLFINDLGSPDKLLTIGSFGVNVLPIVMTLVNLLSSFIFAKDKNAKTKIQLIVMALFFMVFLYNSPSGLVLYWTCNNIFSLVKTIFYKFSDPKKALRVFLASAGALTLLVSVWVNKNYSKEIGLILVVSGAIMIIPLVLKFIDDRLEYSDRAIKIRKRLADSKISHNSRFTNLFASSLFLFVFVGILIPSNVIVSSPLEFTDVFSLENPNSNVFCAAIAAFGALVVWEIVLYLLLDKRKRYIFEIVYFSADAAALLNYFLFAGHFGLLSNTLVYEESLNYSTLMIVLNVVSLFAIVFLVFVIYSKKTNILKLLFSAGVLAVSVIGFINCFRINTEFRAFKNNVNEERINEMPTITLSKNNKNVVVIMLDRAFGMYIPYFLNEKPELKDIYSGFTYYENTVSYGNCTTIGAPGLFGGYEYIPENIYARTDELMIDKHNEALKVMPVIFSENGYDATVLDATLANYSEIPDLSIYDEYYPNIKAYNTIGRFTDGYDFNGDIKRNLFCYSLMEASPLCVRPFLYENGNYNECRDFYVKITYEERKNISYGYSKNFMDNYMSLINYSAMTDIKDCDGGFALITNNITHEPTLLQEPGYEVSERVDNSDYEKTLNHTRISENGDVLKLDTYDKLYHYQTNLCALLRLGEWLEYLKNEGVYDNTRIIIVSDHARNLNHLDSKIDDPEGRCDLQVLLQTEVYYSLLMVKDFDSDEFQISDEFMTNADTVMLATEGIVENPVNPFTQNVIDNKEKYDDKINVFATPNFDADKTVYSYDNDGGSWFTVHDDMRKKENWDFPY